MEFVVGTINVNGSAAGLRLFNLDRQETEDLSKAALYQAVVSGRRKIENVVVDKKAKNFRIINSMPLGIVEKSSIGDTEENIATNVAIILAKVLDDDTNTVVGYLVCTNEPTFAVYRTKDLVDLVDDLNICYKGVSVEDGQLIVQTETELPTLLFSTVRDYVEEYEDETADDDADYANEEQGDYVEETDEDTLDDLLEDDDMQFEETEDAPMDIDADEDIIDETEAEDFTDNIESETEIDEQDIVDEIMGQGTAEELQENAGITTDTDIIDDESDTETLEDLVLETDEDTENVTETVPMETIDDVPVVAESEYVHDKPVNKIEDLPVEDTIENNLVTGATISADTMAQAAEKLSLSISDEFDNSDDKWKITVNSNGEKTTVVLGLYDPSLSAWLKVPGLSFVDNCLRRATTSESLVDSAELVAIVVPKSVKKVFPFAFAYCTALESITFMSDAEVCVPMGCFAGCTALQSVVFNGKPVVVEDYAFADCTAFDGAELVESETLQRIGAYAFTNTATTAVKFKDALEIVGMAAFAMCNKLEKAVLTRAIVMQWASAEKKVDTAMLNNKEVRRKYSLDVFASCTALRELNLRNEDIVRMIPYYLQGTALAQAV